MEHGSRVFEMLKSPHMFRTLCPPHVPNVQDCYVGKERNPCGMSMADNINYKTCVIFKNCAHFSFSNNQILKIVVSIVVMCSKVKIPIIEAHLLVTQNMGNVFRACSAESWRFAIQ